MLTHASLLCCSLYLQVKHFVHIEPGSGGRVDTTSRVVNGSDKVMDCVKNLVARLCCLKREVEMVGFNLKAEDFEEWTSSEEDGGEGEGEEGGDDSEVEVDTALDKIIATHPALKQKVTFQDANPRVDGGASEARVVAATAGAATSVAAGRDHADCARAVTREESYLQEDDTDSYIEDDESANEGVMPIRTAKEAHAAWGQFGGGVGGAGGAGGAGVEVTRGGGEGGGGSSEKTKSKSKTKTKTKATPQADVSAVEMSPLEGWKGNPLIDDTPHSRHEHYSVFGGVGGEGVSEARTVDEMVGNLHNSLTIETAL